MTYKGQDVPWFCIKKEAHLFRMSFLFSSMLSFFMLYFSNASVCGVPVRSQVLCRG